MDKLFGYPPAVVAAAVLLVGGALAFVLSSMYLEGRTLSEMAIVTACFFFVIASMVMVTKRVSNITGNRSKILSDFAAAHGFTQVTETPRWRSYNCWEKLFTGAYKGRAMGLGLHLASSGKHSHESLFAYADCRPGLFEMNLQRKVGILFKDPESMIKFGDPDLDAEFRITANDPIKAKTILDLDSMRQIHAIIGEKSVRTWVGPNLSIAIGRKSATSPTSSYGLSYYGKLPELPPEVKSSDELAHVGYALGSMRRIDDTVLQALLDLAVGLAEKAEK